MVSMTRRRGNNELIVFRQMRRRAYHKQDGHCFFCQHWFPFEEITGDHYVPIYAGGQTRPGNIVAACARCNNTRNAPETNRRGKGFRCVAGNDTPRSPFEVLTDDQSKSDN
jgi:5-methylcytosine-specific restriction endonuclease McrA